MVSDPIFPYLLIETTLVSLSDRYQTSKARSKWDGRSEDGKVEITGWKQGEITISNDFASHLPTLNLAFPTHSLQASVA